MHTCNLKHLALLYAKILRLKLKRKALVLQSLKTLMGLKNKWKVNNLQLILILCTFAIGGSLCGYAARQLLSFLELDKNILWFILYIVFVTILWPVAVILVSIPLGQFPFFKNYLQRIAQRMWGGKKP